MGDMRVCHIWGQHAHHEEAYIVGDRDALLCLKKMIDEALTKGVSSYEFMVNDGEGYVLTVEAINKPWESEEWKKQAVPYIADYAAEKRSDAVFPWQR